jgi:hypothetical protein
MIKNYPYNSRMGEEFCKKYVASTYVTHSRSNTIFVQIYMDPPPRVPGVSKNQNFFSQIKLLSFCANIAPKRHKL